ncbi:hypothetical protein [Lysobacter gummosus]|uniref:hypothetical protein n=1 Tax=Lysobacter gummosus TaxID=262324 RepID=UPI003635B613
MVMKGARQERWARGRTTYPDSGNVRRTRPEGGFAGIRGSQPCSNSQRVIRAFRWPVRPSRRNRTGSLFVGSGRPCAGSRCC